MILDDKAIFDLVQTCDDLKIDIAVVAHSDYRIGQLCEQFLIKTDQLIVWQRVASLAWELGSGYEPNVLVLDFTGTFHKSKGLMDDFIELT